MNGKIPGVFRAALAALLVCALSACGSVNQDFVKAMDESAGVILPRYKDYVDADTTLDPDSKELRKKTADKMRQLIDAAKEEN